MNYSLTQLGGIVTLVSFLLQFFHISIASEELSKAAEAIGVLVGLGISWYGRYRKGDLTVSGFRK